MNEATGLITYSYRVASDIGGTFTDIVVQIIGSDGSQNVKYLKAHTTPPYYEHGILEALRQADIPINAIKQMVHGSTVVINALTERKGAKTGLITTEGFRDILEIARGDRPEFFNLNYQKPKPFVPRYLRQEMPGRMSYLGQELQALDLSKLPQILSIFQHEGVTAIAICLINSYANPAHEVSLIEAVRRIWPDVTLVGSHEITREWHEYERTNTAVLSAYIKPIANAYLDRFNKNLNAQGFKGTLNIMQSNGGVDSLESAFIAPIRMVESGPSSGMYGAHALAKQIGKENIIALDIGGTTAKCSLIHQGQLPVSTDYYIEKTPTSPGYPIMVPVIDIVEVGNGGGSIAWIDAQNKLHVGPQSAGAIPGPVAYNRGGDRITTTDALLSLGRIDPAQFCGGTAKANSELIQSIASRMLDKQAISSEHLLRNIVRVANHNMLQALKMISVNRGHDPRDFSLVAFGGGGGLHACELAHELAIAEVIIPAASSVFSAWGMLLCDLRRDFVRTQIIDLVQINVANNINQSIAEMEQHAISCLAREKTSSDDIRFEHYGRMRYQNQSNWVEVQIPSGTLTTNEVKTLLSNFQNAYERKYSYQLDNPIEIVCLHMVVLIPVNKLSLLKKSLSEDISAQPAWIGTRPVDYLEAGIFSSDIYDASKLLPGMQLKGPAIIQTNSSSVVVLPGLPAAVDAYGNLRISMRSQFNIGKSLLDDAITHDVIQLGLQSTAEEMFAVMRRTAMSPIIYEVLDMGTAITNALGELTSSGAGIPAFINMLDKSITHILKKYSPVSISAGDIYIVNHPYYGGVTHLNDMVIAMPVFSEENELIAWTANIAHWGDIGGMSPGGISTNARELIQEGLQVPPVKIISKGELNQSLFDVILANSRMPEFLNGDFWAGIAAVRVGEKRIRDLLIKYGVKQFKIAVNKYLDYAHQLSLDGLRNLPRCTHQLEEEQDDGEIFKVSITIEENKFIVDLRENPDQHKGPTNVSRDATVVAAESVFKSFTAPTSVCNAGSFRPLVVLTRPGSIFDPTYPAPMGIYYEAMIRLHDLLWHAIAKAMPMKLPAGGFASICGTLFGGTHPDTKRHYSVIEPEVGGWGASSEHDGNSCLFSGIHGNTYNCPAEVSEARNGVLVNRYSFHHHAGGDGKYRGGRGVCIEYKMRSEDGWLTASYTRSRIRPWPLKGGAEGLSNYIEVVRSGGKTERYSSVSELSLNKEDIIRIVTSHGAGWGDAAERDINAVVDDVKNEYISLEQARKFYQLDTRAPLFWNSLKASQTKTTQSENQQSTLKAHY